MVDVFPRRNLPGDAEQWGRDVEGRVVDLSTGQEILDQQLQSQNRNIASSLSVMAGQIQALGDQQEALEAQQVALAAQNATLQSTVNFLSTQTLYDQRTTSSGGSKGPLGAGVFGYEPFDLTYDCEISVTTSSSGKLLLSSGGTVTSVGGLSGIGPEVVGGSLPDFYTSATAGDGSIGASRSVLVTVSPNTTYSIRTRRWWYGTTSQFVSYQAASLVVTRLA